MLRSRRVVVTASFAVAAVSSFVPAQQPYGRGTAGTAGLVPELAATRAQLGDPSFAWDLRAVVPGTVAFLPIGVAPAALPLAGLELAVAPSGLLAVLSTFTSAAGTTSFPLAIPSDPSLVGAAVYSQAVVADTAAPAGLAASRGLRVGFGGDPRILVACSILRSDPYQYVDPIAGSILSSGAPPQTDNVSGAAFDATGQRVFVASSIRGTIGVGDLSSLPITWSTLFASPGPDCYGLGYDPLRQRLWTLTDSQGAGSRDLVAIDADPNSASYGAAIASTNRIVSGRAEIWALAPSGDLAAVMTYLPNSLTIVDLDPSSPTYLQAISPQLPIPVDQASALTLASRVAVTPDERYALVTLQGAGTTPTEIARFDIVAGAWFDHDPTSPSTNIGPLGSPPVILGSAPTTIRISATGRYAIVGGFGGCGWVGRLDLDPADPRVYAWTPFAPTAPLENGWTTALSPDETEVAVATWPDARCGIATRPQLVRIDVATGAQIGTVAIPSNSNGSNQNLYTVVYR